MWWTNSKRYFLILLFLSLFLSAGLSAASLDLKAMTDLELLERLQLNLTRQDEISAEREKTLEELKSQLQESQALSLTLQQQLKDSQDQSALLQIRLTDLELSIKNTEDSLKRTETSLTSLSQELGKKLSTQKMTTVILLILSSAAIGVAAVSLLT